MYLVPDTKAAAFICLNLLEFQGRSRATKCFAPPRWELFLHFGVYRGILVEESLGVSWVVNDDRNQIIRIV